MLNQQSYEKLLSQNKNWNFQVINLQANIWSFVLIQIICTYWVQNFVFDVIVTGFLDNSIRDICLDHCLNTFIERKVFTTKGLY
jgi:hypothetical protein